MQNGLQLFPNGNLKCYNNGTTTDVSINPLSDVNGTWAIQRVFSVWKMYLNDTLVAETSCPGDVNPVNLAVAVHNFMGDAVQGDGLYGTVDNIIWYQ